MAGSYLSISSFSYESSKNSLGSNLYISRSCWSFYTISVSSYSASSFCCWIRFFFSILCLFFFWLSFYLFESLPSSAARPLPSCSLSYVAIGFPESSSSCDLSVLTFWASSLAANLSLFFPFSFYFFFNSALFNMSFLNNFDVSTVFFSGCFWSMTGFSGSH